MESLYQYSSLSPDHHTRILELEPSQNRTDEIRGQLKDINIYDDYDYQALSYTWGKPSFTERIILDHGNSHLMITPNLHDALVRFRDSHKTVKIWIDALCINQKDDVEKSKQIPMMDKIYRTASAVLVWLGDYEKESRSLEAINSASRKLDTPRIEQAILPHIQKVVKLPWFTRRWIVQEVVLNDEVHAYCGQEATIYWPRFIDVVSRLLKFWAAAGNMQVVQMMGLLAEERRDRRRGEMIPEAGILDVLHYFSNLGCADDRDRLYALAGLAADVTVVQQGKPTSENPLEAILCVDYKSSVEDVYIDFAASLLRKEALISKILQVVSQRSNGTHLDNQCSWAPDWRLAPARIGLSKALNLENCKVTTNRATNGLHVIFPKSKNGFENFCGYVRYAKVRTVAPVFPSDASDTAAIDWIRNTWLFIQKAFTLLASRPPTPEDTTTLLTQFERLITENPTRPWVSVQNGVWMDSFRNSSDFRYLATGEVAEDAPLPFRPETKTSLYQIIHVMAGRRLIIATVTCPDKPLSIGGAASALTFTKRIFSRNKTTTSPRPPDQTSNSNTSSWPAIAIAPSHAQLGDILCASAKVDVQYLSNDSDDTYGRSYYEHLGEAACLLRPYSSPQNSSPQIGLTGATSSSPSKTKPDVEELKSTQASTGVPAGTSGAQEGDEKMPEFLYIGDVKAYRLYERKGRAKFESVAKRSGAQHVDKMSSFILR